MSPQHAQRVSGSVVVQASRGRLCRKQTAAATLTCGLQHSWHLQTWWVGMQPQAQQGVVGVGLANSHAGAEQLMAALTRWSDGSTGNAMTLLWFSEE